MIQVSACRAVSFGLVLSISVPCAALAEPWDLNGHITLDSRYFLNDSEYTNQKNMRFSPSASIEFEAVYEANDGSDRLTFTPFARKDADDVNRTHADVRELSWLHLGRRWDMTVGLSKVYWGVTESAHLVDIINQTDTAEDIMGEKKLGQPMININMEQQWGVLNMFVLPGFRTRSFTANDARLHGPLAIDVNNATFEASQKERHLDWAMRWTQTFNNWDIGVSHFQGTSREPRMLPQFSATTALPVLVPHYDLISQTGLELQLTTEDILWKAETISRAGHGPRFAAAVFGFEYTKYSVLNSVADVGVLVEYLYDGREMNLAPPSFANHDLFAGVRMTMNDVQDSKVLMGGMIDTQTHATFLNLEAERRLAGNVKVEINGRLLMNIPDDDGLVWMRNDDFIELKLHWYF